MMKPKTLAILGAGAWGSTLGKVARENGHEVRLWSRREAMSLDQILAGADVILSAVSMRGVTAIVEQVQRVGIAPDTIIVTATKGLDPQSTCTPSQLWRRGTSALGV